MYCGSEKESQYILGYQLRPLHHTEKRTVSPACGTSHDSDRQSYCCRAALHRTVSHTHRSQITPSTVDVFNHRLRVLVPVAGGRHVQFTADDNLFNTFA
jgi:hypothetical protein